MAKKLIDLDSLPKNEQKVLIAKDVLNQIKAKKYKPHAGRYINVTQLVTDCPVNYGDDIKKNFSKIKNCSVCAVASLILSVTKYKNNLKFNDLTGEWFGSHNSKKEKLIKSVFTPKELYEIECCFEGSVSGDKYASEKFGIKKDYSLDKFYKSYTDKYPDDTERLRKIMQNIVRNSGKFLPKQDLKD